MDADLSGNPEPLRLDVRGLQCPLPVLKAAKRMETLQSGDRLELLTTDPMAGIDITHFCREKGHTLIDRRNMGDHECFTITKG